jgi:hypothetical protein
MQSAMPVNLHAAFPKGALMMVAPEETIFRVVIPTAIHHVWW